MWVYYLNVAAIAVFACTGALAAIQTRRGIDVVGVILLGIITATAGGTSRDIILDFRVFWVEDPTLLVAATVASLITFFFRSRVKERLSLLLYLDAVGNALLLVSVMKKVLAAGFSPVIAIAMGVLTGIGGGLLRDVLTGRRNLLLSPELYATPILAGALLYAALIQLVPDSRTLDISVVLFIFIFRAAALRFDWTMPRWLIADKVD